VSSRDLFPTNGSESLTPAEFNAISDIPPELEWLGNITSVAAAVLRTAAGCRQTGQGCGHRRNAKVARCCVECGDSPETLRADNAGPGRDLTPPFGKGYKKIIA
jgi:hypothetical protein